MRVLDLSWHVLTTLPLIVHSCNWKAFMNKQLCLRVWHSETNFAKYYPYNSKEMHRFFKVLMNCSLNALASSALIS